MRRVILSLIMLLGLSAPSMAKPFCVNSSTGSDVTAYASLTTSTTDGTGTCTATIRRAANVALAGDIIYVAPGTYNAAGTGDRWVNSLNPTNEGTVGNPITFIGVGTVNVGLSSSSGPTLGCDGRDYITWRNFHIDEANGVSVADTGPVVGHDSTGCVLENLFIDGNGNGHGLPDNHNGVRLESCTSCVVRDSVIEHVTSSAAVNGSCVTLYGSPNTIIENNSCTDTGSAIYFKDTATQLQSGIHIRKNIISNATSCFRFSEAQSGNDRNFVYQNLCLNAGFGLGVTAGGLHNDWIYNNTFYNLSQSGVFLANGSGSGGRFWNNLIITSPLGLAIQGTTWPADTVIDVEHNGYQSITNFYNGSDGNRTMSSFNSAYASQNQALPASITDTLLLVDPAGSDFRICTATGTPTGCSAASPAVALAIDIGDLDSDTSTVDNVPAGAYVTNSETIGVNGSATTPDAPTITGVTPGASSCWIAFTAGSDGGSAVLNFTATSSPGSLTGSGITSPVTVSGLTNGTSYTFTMTATNAEGTSTASSASSTCVPTSFISPTRVRMRGLGIDE